MKFLVTVVTLSFAFTLGAEAARRDVRQGAQKQRIQQGVKSGELTKGETHKLRKEQRKIRGMENRAESDGEVTAKEKRHIEHAQDKASKHIYNQKHDDQSRGGNDQAPAGDDANE